MKCAKCRSGKHSTLLHREYKPPNGGTNGCNDTTGGQNGAGFTGPTGTNGTGDNGSVSAFGNQVYVPIVKIKVNGEPVNCLIDTGSSCSFITKRLAKKIGVQGEPHAFTLKTINGSMTSETRHVTVNLACVDDSFNVDVSNVLLTDSIPATYPAIKFDVDKNPHLQGIPLAKIPSNTQCDVLLGLDNGTLLAPLEVRRSAHSSIYAVEYVWGWAIHGCIGRELPNSASVNCTQGIEESLSKLWDMDHSADIVESYSIEDQKVKDLWDKEITREGDNYVLPIPLRDNPCIPNNKPMCMARLKSLKNKLERTDMMSKYDDALMSMVDQGFLEHVPSDELKTENDLINYIPHHPVVRPASEFRPEKVRPVFDC